MQAFGITINKNTVPLLYLASAIIGYLFLRESLHMFQHSIAIKAITVFLQIGFIASSLAILQSLKAWNVSNNILKLLALWLTLSCISTLLSDHPWAQMARWFEIYISLIAGFCLYQILQLKPHYKIIIIKAIISSLLFCLLIFLGYWHLLANPQQHQWVNNIPIFLNIRHFGFIVSAALPLGYWLLEQSPSNYRKVYTLAYLSVAWGLTFWLGGRSTFIGLIIVTIIYCILSRHQTKIIISSMLIGLGLSQIFIVDLPNLNLFRLLDIFINSEAKSLYQLTSYRSLMYSESLKYWWQNAPILGIGADGYRYIIPAIAGLDMFHHPHSIIIQLLLSYGVLGLIIPSYLFFLLSFRIFHPQYLCSKSDKTLFLSLLSCTIAGLFNGIYYHAYSVFICGIIIVLCIPPSSNNLNHSHRIGLYRTIILSTLIALIYFVIFSAQVFISKNGCTSKKNIDWNAKYPLYFSPTYSHKRYKSEDIQELINQYYQNRLNHKSCHQHDIK